MKKLLLLLLLFTGMVNAQIVNIPDAAFKAKLLSSSPTVHVGSNVNPNSSITPNVYTTIDTNSDGEIQVSEAQDIIFLNINWFSGTKIESLQGIEAFVNLQQLYCNGNNVTTIDFSNQVNLLFLAFENNLLTSVNITGCSNLNDLDFYNNHLSFIDFSGCPLMSFLNLSHNQFQTFDTNGLQNLRSLEIGFNNLTTINVSNKFFLTDLYLGYNQLTDVQLINLPHLYKVNIQNNQLTSLDLSTVAYEYYTSGTPTYEINCNNNANLTHINLKNGYVNDDVFIGSTNLNNQVQYICKDEGDIFTDFFVNTNSLFSTYCNFTPGGNYNTISGNVKYDSNNNGCDASDLPQSNIRVNINDGTNQGASFTSNTGNYFFFTQTGSFDLTFDVENPNWFVFSPNTATIPFADNNNNLATQDFCISANGVHNDLEVVISPVTPARPGFDAVYNIVYKNKGNQTLSGNVSFTYDDTVLDFVSATVAPNTQNSGILNWNYTNLVPFESRSFYITLNVNSPTETPAVNIGEVLTLNATITPVATDEIPADNSFSYHQTVVGAFDPNNIICIEGTSVSPSTIGDYLHYAINFENTGNYPAENIVVKTIIDPTKFDINSLQLLNTSYPVEARITGNVVEFIFKTIHLATGGHGHILLKMRSKGTLVEGDSVSKRADIFFDYNAPIDTGLVNTIFETLSNSIVILDNSVSVYPNPTSSIINVNCNSTIKTMELFDIQGRILVTKIVDESQSNLDISTYSSGVYFVKITTEKGSKVQKIVKE